MEVWSVEEVNHNGAVNNQQEVQPNNMPNERTNNGSNGINGFQKIFINNPYLVGVQSKFRRKYYHKTLFAILIFIIVILIIAIICVAVRAKYSYDVCETKECLRAASSLLLSMDQTADPCEDFYQFTCGNWHEEHPIPDTVNSFDWFSDKQNKVMRTIRDHLQLNQTITDPQAVNKTKIMYEACMNTKSMNNLGLKPIFKLLEEFKLPLIPKILNQTNKTSYKFDWIETIVRVKLALGLDLLVGFDIFSDPSNRTLNRVAVGTPDTDSVLPFTHNPFLSRITKKRLANDLQEMEVSEDDDISSEAENTLPPSIKAYLMYIQKVIVIFVKTIYPKTKISDLSEPLINAAVSSLRITKKILEITDIAENVTKSNANTSNPIQDYIYLTTKDLENMTNELILPKSLPIYEKYLPIIFKNFTNIKFDFDKEKLLTSKGDILYLQSIKELLTNQTQENLEFFLWWNIVEELVTHTSTDILEIYTEYTKIITKTESSQPRSIHCATGVNKLMGMAVSYTLANDNFLIETLPKVETMLQNIRESFNGLVKATNWMDNETKKQTLEKSDNMKSFIGFPEWIKNKTELDKYYFEIDANETTHLYNMINVLRWQMKTKVTKYKEPAEFGWATTPSNVNAFHTFQANAITIPIAILQYPFYELGLEALNYGSIGTVLGHELTHGFDDSGRMFDKNGNIRQWWTQKTIKEYINRTQCFIKQYGTYKIPEVNDNIDGELTLGENIADNGGLREAYLGYKLLQNKIGKEKYLPGLDNYTHEQLLFISFGNLWCETLTSTSAKYALEDSHCPGSIRLKGVLSNSPEFSEVFNCKKGSGMYPTDNRCRIW